MDFSIFATLAEKKEYGLFLGFLLFLSFAVWIDRANKKDLNKILNNHLTEYTAALGSLRETIERNSQMFGRMEEAIRHCEEQQNGRSR